jgi:N-acetylmuramoyl-L-alanine amidase
MRILSRGLRARAALVTVALAVAMVAWPAAQTGTPAPTSGPPATVKSITRLSIPRGDRIIIELSREVPYTADRASDPDRLFFDVANSIVPGSTSVRAQALTGTWITGVRVGQHTETSMRIVLQLTGTPRYSVFALYAPFRLVIDLEHAPELESSSSMPASRPVANLVADVSTHEMPVVAPPLSAPAPPPPNTAAAATATSPSSTASTTSAAPASSTPVAPATAASTPASTPDVPLKSSRATPVALPAPPASTAHGDYSLSRQLGLGLSRIVIDPGHGGHDPGAQGNGIDEANLVLDVALRLEALLKAQPDFDVVMTRRTDEFIPLEERTAIANREGADLFLSIHANATRDTLVRGVETYFLNFATNPGAEAVAARENATGGKTMGSLPDLVKSITLNNKIEESREFATLIQSSMIQDLRSPQRSIKDLGVKQAPFVVLIGAQMPSVLAEISFLTNRADAVLLKTPAYRQSIAQALYDAVARYRGSLKRVAPASNKDGAIH